MNTLPDPECEVVSAGVKLPGLLHIPDSPLGCVVFVHGSGSGHRSPRNLMVAGLLNRAGFATLLFDLLTANEDEPGHEARFDIDRLTRRVVGALQWVRHQPSIADLPLGLFGASTGAAAALRAAGAGGVACVVSRGGRPDLAGREALGRVTCPTLLIVGSHDDLVLALNQRAMAEMRCEKQLVTIAGATHLFEEPGTLDAAAQAAVGWFSKHLAAPRQAKAAPGMA